ncbi:MAG: hypothetical protein WD885_00515 [Candidatus Saccharimonadales bacterium]
MRGNKDGFGLVELVTDIALFGIVSIAMINLSTLVMNVQTSSRYRQSATLAAQGQIETLRNSNFTSLEDGQVIDFTSDLPDFLPAGKSGIVEVSEPEPGLKRADVTITYPQGGNDKEIKLSAIIGELGITQ